MNYKILSKGDWADFCDKSRPFTNKTINYTGYTVLLKKAYDFHLKKGDITDETSIREQTFITHNVVFQGICNRVGKNGTKRMRQNPKKKNIILTAQLFNKYVNKIVEGHAIDE